MRYTNEKSEAVSQINDPSLQYIVQTIYQFYRTTGSLSAAISQAATHLNMSSADVAAVAEEYELTDEMDNNPGSIDPADAVTLGESVEIVKDFQIPGTDYVLEAGDCIKILEDRIKEGRAFDQALVTAKDSGWFEAGSDFIRTSFEDNREMNRFLIQMSKMNGENVREFLNGMEFAINNKRKSYRI